MKFELDSDQRAFASALDDLLRDADTPAVVRAWGRGEHEPGLAVWKRLAGLGVTSLTLPDSGATPVDLVVAFEALGRHAVPGPWIESVAYLPVALRTDLSEEIATVALPPYVPYAVDADIATRVYLGEHTAARGSAVESLDPARRLFAVEPVQPDAEATLQPAAFSAAVLACSATLLGLGERMLGDTVEYAKQRTQFGRPIGANQAIKHALADVRIALDFARPLLHGAAVGDVPASAAKVSCGDAALLSARTALQVHGAIGYTAELDLSLWLLRTRAMVSAWGTSSWHRARLLDSLTGAPT
jgi:alkylation response protein AidB-like acyl-CoA dehydrogenase